MSIRASSGNFRVRPSLLVCLQTFDGSGN